MSEPLPCTGPASCQRREIVLSAPPEAARAAVEAAIRETHGIVIGRAGAPTATGDGLHAEYRVAFGLFVDDVDAHIATRGAQTVVTLRSASRVGRGDLGVNALRMRALERAVTNRVR